MDVLAGLRDRLAEVVWQNKMLHAQQIKSPWAEMTSAIGRAKSQPPVAHAISPALQKAYRGLVDGQGMMRSTDLAAIKALSEARRKFGLSG
jgi:hypothetical protein